MDLTILEDTPSWDWPENADTIILAAIQDALHRFFLDTTLPTFVRRRVIEASVRAAGLACLRYSRDPFQPGR